MGAIVCPTCNNVLIRLFDHPDGIEASCWVPAKQIGTPQSKSFGYTMWGVIDAEIIDDEEQSLHCWNGHHGLVVTARQIRELAMAYRSKGKEVRRPAATLNPGDEPAASTL